MVDRPNSPSTAYVGVRLTGGHVPPHVGERQHVVARHRVGEPGRDQDVGQDAGHDVGKGHGDDDLLMTGPTCWVMISSIGAADAACDGVLDP